MRSARHREQDCFFRTARQAFIGCMSKKIVKIDKSDQMYVRVVLLGALTEDTTNLWRSINQGGDFKFA